MCKSRLLRSNPERPISGSMKRISNICAPVGAGLGVDGVVVTHEVGNSGSFVDLARCLLDLDFVPLIEFDRESLLTVGTTTGKRGKLA